MDRQVVRKYRWFWSWQDRELEQWLHEMSLEGLHLTGFRWGAYEFERGEPIDFIYSLDCTRASGREYGDYLAFFRDAGWEHRGKLGSWQVFRQQRSDTPGQELYTDPESKIAKYNRLLVTYFTPSPAILVVFMGVFKRYPGRHPAWFVALFFVLFTTWTLYAAVNVIMITRRIQELKHAKPTNI